MTDGNGLVRVFPRATSMTPRDALAFVGPPPLMRPPGNEVHISVTFAQDLERGRYLRDAWAQYYPVVRLGGPAVDGEGTDFEPGRYLKSGITITSRGCVHRCPWCIVSSPIRCLLIKPGHIIQDNNLLATGRRHTERVLEMLRRQPRPAVFSGGLDARLLKDWFVDELRGLRIDHLFLAADTDDAMPAVARALEKLRFLPRRKLRCYVLWGFGGESLDAGEYRCRQVWELGALPFAQLFQPVGTSIRYRPEDRRRARLWQRPALTKVIAGGNQQ